MLVLRHPMLAHVCRPPAHAIARSCALPAVRTNSQLVMLGIESSCDDTGVAVVTSQGQVLGEVVVPQVDIHAPWGGVVPKLAQQAHAEAMDSAIASALASASVRPETLSGVAVTIGPGLSLCLHVGVRAAHALARSACVPFVPVHHMEAHALVARAFDSSVRFPFLCLLVSGGHNLLLVVHGVGHYTQLGTTLDDALGEAYDKVARLLGLPLTPSGGAALEQLALQGDAARFALPLPLKKHADCNFSYAGLKTAVRLLIEAELGGEDCLQTRADIAASFQRVAVQHLAQRTARGVQWARDQVPALDTLVVAGGVAANATVRAQLLEVAQDAGLRLVCPPPRYCTDNGVMVAWAGIERHRLGLSTPPSELHVPASEDEEWLELRPRWPLTSDVDPRGAPPQRSARKKRLHPDLSLLTREQLASQTGGR